MMMLTRLSLVGLFLLSPAVSFAEEPDDAATAHEYVLRYKYDPGEQIRWKVVHLGSTETRIQGNTQTSRSRSESVKVWKVTGINEEGHITFTHSVESVDMWQKLTDRPEVRYNSNEDAQVPQEYEHVAATIGNPLTTVTITSEGQILEREEGNSQIDLGLGDIVMLLPPKPVKLGSNWYEPAELRVREQSGHQKRIKIRKRYTLKKISAGVATIDIRTEVLTPIDDARIEAQLVQQVTNGSMKFDLDAGRILSKQMDWDETIVGFNGNDSMMKYLARFTEEILTEDARTAERPSPAAPN